MTRIFVRKAVAFFAFFLFSQSGFALSFSLLPYFGVSVGKVTESLYNAKIKSAKNSLLEWEHKPFYIFALEAKGEAKKFCFGLDFNYALPVRCGDMKDSDFLTDGTKIAYSINENTAKTNIRLSASVAYRLKFSKTFSILPKLTVQYDFNSFEAKNGYGWYGFSDWTSDGKTHAWNDAESHYFPDGKKKLSGVDYKEHSLFTFVGFDFSFTIKRFSFSVAPFVSVFTFNFLEDKHYSYTETGKFKNYFNAFKADFCFSYKINSFLSIINKIDLLYQNETRGTRKQDGYKLENKKGTSLWDAGFFIGAEFCFERY